MISAEKIPNNVDLLQQQAAAARARALAAAVHPVVEGHGAAGLPGLPPGLRAHRDQRRSGRLGALRVREAAGVPLGHLPRRSRARSAHRLRRLLRPAGLAGSARRVPQPAAPPDRHAGRHRAGERRAAALARPALPEPLRPAQSLPGERRGGPPPVGDGLPAALVLRPRRPRRGGGAARAAERQPRQAAHPRGVQRADRQLARLLHVHDVHRPRRQVAAAVALGELARSAVAHDAVHADRGSAPHVRRRDRHRAHRRAHVPADEGEPASRRTCASSAASTSPTIQKYINLWFSLSLDLHGSEISTNAASYFANGLKGRARGREVGRPPRRPRQLYDLEVARQTAGSSAGTCRCATR